MDIAIIEHLVTAVGVPIACTAIFLWIVIDVYKTSKTKVTKYLEEQSGILEKQTDTVESIAHAIEVTTTALDKICTIVLHIESLCKEIKAKDGTS